MEKENMSIAEKLKQRADAQWKAKYPEKEPVNNGNADTRGLVVGGTGVLAKFVGNEIDRTAANAQERQAKQQMQVNQANTEVAVDVNGNTQQASGTSIASPIQEQVSNAIGLRRHNDIDTNLIQGMIPAKGTQLEAEKDKASAKILKQATVPLGAAPDAKQVKESYKETRKILDGMAKQKETEFGTNPLTMLFYDLFMAPGQLALADRNIALYEQANKQYSTEAELYTKKLQYNKDLYEQYMKGKTEYFKNAMQDSMIAKSGTNYTDSYDYKAQAIGAQFDTVHKERLDYLHKRGEDLHKLFDEGKSIGIDGTKSMIARLTNDGDTGQLLLADVGSLYGRLVEHDENFDFATHQLVDTLKGKGYNNAALDTAKIIANNDMLKAKIRAVNAANQAGVGKGAFQFWKSEFSPQMVAEVCTALDALDGYRELSDQYAQAMAVERYGKATQFADANMEVRKALSDRDKVAWDKSHSQGELVTVTQVESDSRHCQEIIDNPKSTPVQKYSAYLAMGVLPGDIPDEVVADFTMTAPFSSMAAPFNQEAAKQAMVNVQNMILPLFSSFDNLQGKTAEKVEKFINDLDAEGNQEMKKMVLNSMGVDTLSKLSSVLNNLSDAELQQHMFQMKHSREYKQAVINTARNALQNAVLTDGNRVINTNGNAGITFIDAYVRRSLKDQMKLATLYGRSLDPAVFLSNLKGKINAQLSNNGMLSLMKYDIDEIDKMVEQHWGAVSQEVAAEIPMVQTVENTGRKNK